MKDSDLIQVIANTYREAALTNVNMRDATEALETIRSIMKAGQDPFKTWNTIDEQIGRAEADYLQPILIQLRKKFVQYFFQSEIARLHEVFQQDPQTGWQDLLLTYAKAMHHWRTRFCIELIKKSFPLKPPTDKEAREILKFTKLVLHERWPETYNLFISLAAKDFIPTDLRANFLVIAGEIQLYWLNEMKPNIAKELFTQAKNLASNEPSVLEGWGEYYLEQSELEKAKESFQAAIDLEPRMASSYTGIGKCFEKQGDLDAAEKWHYEAIRNASGNSSGYMNLLDLYGRTKLFATRKERFTPLVEKAIAVEPDSKYSLYASIGYIYQKNNEYQEAHKWFDKAIELDKHRLSGYINKGYAYVQEKKYDQACVAFKEAIKVASEAFDGYWGMSLAQERLKLWKEARRSLEQSMKRRPEWKEIIQERIDKCEWNLGQHNKVITRLVDALRLEPENQKLTSRLRLCAEDLLESFNDADGALEIYSEMRSIIGVSFEATYHNLVGNLKYYTRQFEEARDSYIKAIQNNPKEAIYYSNLAGAWRELEESGRRIEAVNQAIYAFEQASNLTPDNKTYRDQLDELQKRKSLITFFGERGIELPLPMVTPIALEVAGNLIPYVEGKEEAGLSPQLKTLTDNLRKRIRDEMGVIIPGIRFRGNEDLENGTYTILLKENPIITGKISQGKRLFCGGASDLARLGIKADQETDNPLTREISFWIDEKDWEKIESAKLELWDVMEYPLRHLEAVIRRNLAEFLGHQEVMTLLESLDCDVCNKIRNSRTCLTALVLVLQALITEQVSITAFQAICNEFNSLYDLRTDPMAIVEGLRSTSKIRGTLPGNSSKFTLYQLGQYYEEQILQSIKKDGHLVLLDMKPEECMKILTAVRDKIEGQNNVALIVDKAELRSLVSELIQIEFLEIPVLSRNELITGLEKNIIMIQPTGNVTEWQKPVKNYLEDG